MDDTIAIKSGRDADGGRLHTPSQNIVIMNSKFESNRGMVACGSIVTDVKSLTYHNVTINGVAVK